MADVKVTKDGVTAVVDDSELESAKAMGWKIPPPPSMADKVGGAIKGAASAVVDKLSGAEKRTAETEAAPDVAMMPEMRTSTVSRIPGVGGIVAPAAASIELAIRQLGKDNPSVVGFLRDYTANLKTGVGTQLASPEEQAKIIKANNPDVVERRDDKGNIFLKSAADGREYVLKPEVTPTDVMRGAQTAATFIPAMEGGLANVLAGEVGKVAGAAVGGGLIGTGIQASQALTGGTFNPADVVVDAASSALPMVAGAGMNAAKSGLRALTADAVIPAEKLASMNAARDAAKAAYAAQPLSVFTRAVQGLSPKQKAVMSLVFGDRFDKAVNLAKLFDSDPAAVKAAMTPEVASVVEQVLQSPSGKEAAAAVVSEAKPVASAAAPAAVEAVPAASPAPAVPASPVAVQAVEEAAKAKAAAPGGRVPSADLLEGVAAGNAGGKVTPTTLRQEAAIQRQAVQAVTIGDFANQLRAMPSSARGEFLRQIRKDRGPDFAKKVAKEVGMSTKGF